MERLMPVKEASDILPRFQNTPLGDLLAYHNLGVPFRPYKQASLLIGMCLDYRERLRMPENFAYIIRAAAANLRYSPFQVSYTVAIGGVSAIAIIGHTNCGMVNLRDRRDQFVSGLVQHGGWRREWAASHFTDHAPRFEIADEVAFVLSEARRIRRRYPKVLIAGLMYCVEDSRLYQLMDPNDGGDEAPRHVNRASASTDC
jgi:carbonic anhydrase